MTAIGLAVLGPAAALTLTISHALATVIVGQIVLALLVALIGIHAGRLLHDTVPSTIRAGVSSGAGTLSWVLFLPFSLVFGWLARQHGVDRAGWMLTGAAALVGILVVIAAFKSAPQTTPAVATPADLACRELVELVTNYLDGVLPPEWRASVDEHLSNCQGCSEYTRQILLTMEALRGLVGVAGPATAVASSDEHGHTPR
jgi:MFS family permease